MKIYTKSGDAGETGLFGGPRVSKDDVRVEAYGAVDELNAALGVARTHGRDDADLDALLASAQDALFAIGADLATPATARARAAVPEIGPEAIAHLEASIDRLQGELAPLRNFILPGGAPLASALHLARAVARRAERRVVALHRREPVRAEILAYLNRLSDFLFVAARAANRRAGVPEAPWVPGRRG